MSGHHRIRQDAAMEYAHHGDPLVPRQQRFGLYTRTLMKGLGVPVENRFGLRPAVVKDTNQIAPITAMRDLDTHGWLANVTTFNFHPAPAALCTDHERHAIPSGCWRGSRSI